MYSHAVPGTAQDIEALERRLYDAMIRDDRAALASLISDKATYVHANGIEETKEEYLRALDAGAYEYDRIEASNVTARVHDTMAVETGIVVISVGPRGEPKAEVPLLSTLIWIVENERWRLLRRHATRLPAKPS